MSAVGREYLDSRLCRDPKCQEDHGGEIELRSVCHGANAFTVKYVDGLLKLACNVCGKSVNDIIVGRADGGATAT